MKRRELEKKLKKQVEISSEAVRSTIYGQTEKILNRFTDIMRLMKDWRNP